MPTRMILPGLVARPLLSLIALVLLVSPIPLGACKGGDESPVPEQPPSPVARLAAQACACTTLECLTPLQNQLAGIIAAQHSGANAAKDNADATARVAECAARLKAK